MLGFGFLKPGVDNSHRGLQRFTCAEGLSRIQQAPPCSVDHIKHPASPLFTDWCYFILGRTGFKEEDVVPKAHTTVNKNCSVESLYKSTHSAKKRC